jgi:outer membrane receptor protein involved in Fe transport
MPGLKTQSIDDFEVNCTFNYKHLQTEIRAFYAINNDIIQGGGIQLIAPEDDTRYQYFWWTLINSGNIKSAGLEFFIKTYYKNFQMEFSHAYVRVLATALQFDTDLFVRTSQNKFLNYPDNVSRFHVTWRAWKNLRLRSDMLLDFGRYQGDPLFSAHSGHAELAPYYQKTKKWLNINSGIIYQPFTHWELSAHFYNLLNQRPYWPVVFQNNQAVTATPRSFKVGISFLF